MFKSIMDNGADKESALNTLDNFINTKLHCYDSKRNFDLGPSAHDNVSLLSPYIRHRIITEEEVINKAITKFPLPKVEKFVQEVFWRTYWKSWLELRPKVWMDYNLLLDNKNDKNHIYEKVLSLNTGIDCFDFWTEELIKTNYLHNHARMWYASIWIHTLKIPWHLGADLFLNNLLDGDPASNTLSWRWVAGIQTKGKAYLAKDWNIKKFTNNRFSPKETDFSSTPAQIDFINYEMNSIKFHEGREFNWDESGLLVTTEDIDVLSCNRIDFPIQYGYILSLTNMEIANYSDNVSSFKRDICTSSQKLLSQHIENIEMQSTDIDQIEQITLWAKRNNIKNIVTLACPCGHTRDFINILKKELKKESIEIIKLYRDYDMKYWNLASGSFFNFFKKAVKKI
tara:strand:- start:56 stop:1249 length:1194 start_codon:yes stop_codon:yes gene_type:complete